MDADDIIVSDIIFPKQMNSDSYTFKFGKTFVYYRQLLLLNKLKWVFKGVLHEYVKCLDKQDIQITRIHDSCYIESRRLGDRNKDPERTKQLDSSYKRTYYKKYTDKLKARVSKWQMANPERTKEINKNSIKRYNRKHVDNLSEQYVKKLITNYTPLKPSDINQELVELKRKSIKLQRQLKQKT